MHVINVNSCLNNWKNDSSEVSHMKVRVQIDSSKAHTFSNFSLLKILHHDMFSLGSEDYLMINNLQVNKLNACHQCK
jgi:hypothetical protein